MNSSYPVRRVEWISATAITGLGLALLAPGQTMRLSVTYDGLLAWAPEAAWGALCLVTGFVRIAALVINGKVRLGSPIARGSGAIVGVGVWIMFLYAFVNATARLGAIPFGLPLVIALMAADVLAAVQSAIDLIAGMEKRARENARTVSVP